MYIILVYDIKSDEKGAFVLNKVFKICKEYLFRIQNSVFEGELSNSQFVELKNRVEKQIRKDVDSVVIYKINNKNWLMKESMGVKIDIDDCVI